MMRYIWITAVVLGTSAVASAQFPGQPGSQFGPIYQTPSVMPNIFNPRNQPLSPYLNLLRGGLDPAVNYYYGVRPATVGGTGFSLGAPFTASGGNKPLFFPQLASAPDPLQPAEFQPREVGKGDILPPAGHQVQFGNTMGYFPTPGGNRGNGRPGFSGVGAGRR